MSKDIVPAVKEIAKAVGEVAKIIPSTAREGRMTLESSYNAYFTKKDYNIKELASALWGSGASAAELAKALHQTVISHSQLSLKTKESIQTGIFTIQELAPKAEREEERRDILNAIMQLCQQAKDLDDSDKKFFLKTISIVGGVIVLIGGTIIIIRSPKLGEQILKHGVKLLKK